MMNCHPRLIEVAGRSFPIREDNAPPLQRSPNGLGGRFVRHGFSVLNFRERGPGDAGGLGELLLAEAQERACLPDLTGRDPHFC